MENITDREMKSPWAASPREMISIYQMIHDKENTVKPIVVASSKVVFNWE